jgi:hypothetical protein
MTPNVQRMVDLVHQLDDLLAERAKLTTDIDIRIAAVEAQIDSQRTATGVAGSVTGAIAHPVAGSVVATIKAGSHAEKIVKLLVDDPTLTDAELTKKIYGEDNKKTRHNLGAVLWGLRKTGRLPARQKAEAHAA